MKKLTTTLTLILLISGQLLSQVWPVRVVTTLIPPYPTKIYGYTDGFTENMKVMVFLNDFSKSNYKVKLRLVIEGNGIKITNPPSHTPNPIYINGGVPSNFSGYDLRDYFHSDNLVVSGMSRRSLFNSGGRLPEGFYRIGWQVYDYNRNVPVSDVGSFRVWLMLNDPPELIMPRSDATVELVGVQNIVFNWMAQHLGSPNSSGITDYTFELFEKQIPSYSPLTIVNSTRPVYTETTNMTTLILDEGKIMLHPGFDYVWRVRASEKDGKDVFKNKGYSSLRQFKFRLKCDEPMSISSKVHTDKMATISWAPPASADKYIVEYKASHEDVFRKQETEELEYEFTKLQPDTKYEYRISSVCGNFTGKSSAIYNFKTEVAEKQNYKCGGNLPEPKPTNNTTPLKNLYPGDSFMGGGGFMIKVVKVSGSDGVFSGDGYVIMPWFNFAKMQCLWKNIKINTDFRLFEGTVEVVSAFKHPNYPKLDLSIIENPVTREEEKNENDVLTSIVKSVETAVDSVYITEDGDVMIATPDGEPQAVPLKEGESVAIREKDGTTHVVKDGKVTTFSKEEYEHLYSKGTNRPFGEKAEKDSVESHDHLKYLPDVVFKPYEKMFYGFDKYKYPQVKNKYKTETIKGQEYTLPYKSVSKDGFEHVLAVIELNDTVTTYNNVKFYTDTDAPIPKYPSETDSIKKLLINQPCKWIGAYYHYTDTTGEEHKYLLNKLMVKRYDRKSKDIVLVSVNGCSFPPNPGQTIPKLFDQAVADVNIEKITKFEVPRFEEQKFSNTGVSRLRDYNKDMKYLIKRFKKSFKVDRKKHYLFFIRNVKDPSVTGYWPFKERYGFVFTNNSIPSLAAHEIGHGVFRLEHPSEEYKIPNASDNLMYKNDARGSKLIMPQWDFLNDPPFRIYWFKKEEDHQSKKFGENTFMVKRYLEEFRYCHAFKIDFNFNKSFRIINSKNSTILYDDNEYKPIYIENLSAKDFILSPKFDYAELKDNTKIHNYKVFEFSNNHRISVHYNNVEIFRKYAFPNRDTWSKWLTTKLRILKKDDVFEFFKVFPVPAIKKVKFNDRIRLIKFILSTKNYNQERVLINLVKYLPDNQISNLFLELQRDNLMQKLCNTIDNWGGSDNYTEFISCLTSLFIKWRYDDLMNAKNNWQKYKSGEISWENLNLMYLYWNKSNYVAGGKVTNWGGFTHRRYEDCYKENKIYFKLIYGGWAERYSIDTPKPYNFVLNPFEIILVNFQTPPKHISKKLPKNILLPMPAFLFEWMNNEYNNQEIAKWTDLGITIASFYFTVGALSKGYKLFLALKAFVTAVNIAMLDNKFKEYISTLSNSLDILQIWNFISTGFSIIGPIEEIAVKGLLANKTKFFTAWKGFKETKDFQDLLLSKDKNLIEEIDKLIKQWENEEK